MGLISQSARDIASTWKTCKFLSPRDDEAVEKLLKRLSDANAAGPPPKPRIRVPGWEVPKPVPLPDRGYIREHWEGNPIAHSSVGGFRHVPRYVMSTTAPGSFHVYACTVTHYSTAGSYRHRDDDWPSWSTLS